ALVLHPQESTVQALERRGEEHRRGDDARRDIRLVALALDGGDVRTEPEAQRGEIEERLDEHRPRFGLPELKKGITVALPDPDGAQGHREGHLTTSDCPAR